MSKGKHESALDKIIKECLAIEGDGTPEQDVITEMQLHALMTVAKLIRERIWLQYRFKFLEIFVLFGMTDGLNVAESISLARKLANSRDDEEIFKSFYYMLQESYVDSLEGGDDDGT